MTDEERAEIRKRWDDKPFWLDVYPEAATMVWKRVRKDVIAMISELVKLEEENLKAIIQIDEQEDAMGKLLDENAKFRDLLEQVSQAVAEAWGDERGDVLIAGKLGADIIEALRREDE